MRAKEEKSIHNLQANYLGNGKFEFLCPKCNSSLYYILNVLNKETSELTTVLVCSNPNCDFEGTYTQKLKRKAQSQKLRL